MSRPTSLAVRFGLLLGLGALSVVTSLPDAMAQDACPAGYYYDPTYGCVPYSYLTWPYYVYPDYGFDFFYGPGWGGGWWRGHPDHGPHGGGGVHGGGHPGHGGGHGGSGLRR